MIMEEYEGAEVLTLCPLGEIEGAVFMRKVGQWCIEQKEFCGYDLDLCYLFPIRRRTY